LTDLHVLRPHPHPKKKKIWFLDRRVYVSLDGWLEVALATALAVGQVSFILRIYGFIHSWVSHCVTSRKVAGSIPDEVMN
jgi:hypothetical protein